MKILLIHQYFLEENDSGGTRFNEMAGIWSENGHEITVLAGMIHANANEKRAEYKGKYFFHKQHGKVSVWRCHTSEKYNTNYLGRLWGYFSFVISSMLAGCLKLRSKFDLILVTSPPLFVGITALFLSGIKRIPYVFEVRDLWPESAIDAGILKNKFVIRMAYWFERLIYRKARLITVLTPAFRDILIRKKNIPPDKIIFIPNAVDFSLLEEVLQGFDPVKFRIKQGLNERFIIVYVGAHGIANHLVQLLDTAELVKDTNVVFQLIGNGMEKQWLIEEARRRNVKNVIFHEPVSKKDIFKFILASDLGTSVLKRADTFKTVYSNKTFDYMACRKPILMIIDGVSRELVEKADCGVFAEPEFPEDIADKIQFYLKNPTSRITHGENGYKFAREHFDRKSLAKKYLEYLINC
jgi:glycosyltransferase involved in cell wall biosynthesis